MWDIVLGNAESVTVNHPVEEEMETTGDETGHETVANTHSSQQELQQTEESKGKIVDLQIIQFYS